MTLQFNPISRKLDYFLHQGIGSYKFTGWIIEGELIDPGVGNAYFLIDGYGFGYAVLSATDSHGYDMAYNLGMIFLGLEYYDCILYFHSKANSDRFIGFIIIPDEEWLEVLDAEERFVGLAIPIWPVFFSATYDEELDEITIEEFLENDEVLIHMDLGFNPEYLGSMGTQNSDSVSITGGDISGVNLWGDQDKTWTLPEKVTTGDPTDVDRKIYVNQFDKLVRIYLDGAWRTLLDFS